MIRKIDRMGITKKMEYHEHLQFIEVSPLASYDEFHLPRAIHLSFEQLQSEAASGNVHSQVNQMLGKEGPEIIVYDDHDAERAHQAARILQNKGYHNLYVYEGGKADWVQAGGETEVFAAPSPAQYNPTFPNEQVQPEQMLD